MKSVGGKIVSTTASGDKGIPPGLKSKAGKSVTKGGLQSSTPVGVTWMGQKDAPKSPKSKAAPLD